MGDKKVQTTARGHSRLESGARIDEKEARMEGTGVQTAKGKHVCLGGRRTRLRKGAHTRGRAHAWRRACT
jgi:hypothetical protein